MARSANRGLSRPRRAAPNAVKPMNAHTTTGFADPEKSSTNPARVWIDTASVSLPIPVHHGELNNAGAINKHETSPIDAPAVNICFRDGLINSVRLFISLSTNRMAMGPNAVIEAVKCNQKANMAETAYIQRNRFLFEDAHR